MSHTTRSSVSNVSNLEISSGSELNLQKKSTNKCKHGVFLAALTTRIIFGTHCAFAILWIVFSTIDWNIYYYLLLVGVLCLLFESCYTLVKRKGRGYKWITPSVICYLVTIVPCVWIMELHLLDDRLDTRDEFEANLGLGLNNLTGVADDQNDSTVDTVTGVDGETFLDIEIPIVGRLLIPTPLPPEMAVFLEQLLVFLLILGRWLMPKGNISRNELSQLLLVYLTIASDILEFFEVFNEENVRYNRTLVMIILGVISLSLLQFCIVVTATVKRRKSEVSIQSESEVVDGGGCCDAEVSAIVTTVFLQDGPFLVLRLLLFIEFHVRSYMHMFFTIKNILVIGLVLYRICAICENRNEARRKGSRAHLGVL